MKILLTGGDGRLGNVLVRKLLEQGHQVKVLLEKSRKNPESLQGLAIEPVYGDILDRNTVAEALEDVEVVYHLAAKISLYPDKDGSTWAINVEGTQNIANLALEKKVKRFIHCSSHHALEKKPYNSPMDETRPLAFKEKSTYHRAKAYAEQIILDLVEKGLPALIVNPGTITGPYDFEPSIFGQALIDMQAGKIPMLMEGLSDYADVRDIADTMVTCLERGRIGERYFLTGDLLNMRELSALVGKITGKKTPKKILPLWVMYMLLPFIQLSAKLKGEKPLFTSDMLHAAQSNPVVSHEKAKQELNFHPRSIEESLRDAFEWYQENGKM